MPKNQLDSEKRSHLCPLSVILRRSIFVLFLFVLYFSRRSKDLVVYDDNIILAISIFWSFFKIPNVYRVYLSKRCAFGTQRHQMLSILKFVSTTFCDIPATPEPQSI